MKFLNSLTLFVLIAMLSFSTIVISLERAWADEVIKTIEVGDFPRTLEYNPHNDNIYVANQHSGDVSVIDSSTNMVIATVDVGIGRPLWNTILIMTISM